MKVFDPIMNKEVVVQELVTPEVGVEIVLNDPESFKKIFDCLDEPGDEKEGH